MTTGRIYHPKRTSDPSCSNSLISVALGPSWCALSFVGEPIHHLLSGKSGDGKATDRLQAVVAAVVDEILRSEDGSLQATSKFLEPRRKVYRRADASEIPRVAATDIAAL